MFMQWIKHPEPVKTDAGWETYPSQIWIEPRSLDARDVLILQYAAEIEHLRKLVQQQVAP